MKIRSLTFILLTLFAVSSCNPDYSPKPRGYYRIELPEKKYKSYSGNGCNYSFDIPVYAYVEKDNSSNTRPCWNNVVYPTLNGRLHLSYFDITSPKMFEQLTEDSRRLAFKHTVKAEGIDESRISNAENKVYGLYYDISGNTASSVQFFLTDSNKHFLRGALYFYAEPRQDSIQPVLTFVKQDIDRMLKTFRWK